MDFTTVTISGQQVFDSACEISEALEDDGLIDGDDLGKRAVDGYALMMIGASIVLNGAGDDESIRSVVDGFEAFVRVMADGAKRSP